MPDVLIRGVDKSTLERLKRRAKRHGRSLQAETKLLLEEAARLESVVDVLASWEQRLADRTMSASAELIREDRQR